MAFFKVWWDARGRWWKGVNLSEKVSKQTCPLQWQKISLSFWHCLFRSRPLTPKSMMAALTCYRHCLCSSHLSVLCSFLRPSVSCTNWLVTHSRKVFLYLSQYDSVTLPPSLWGFCHPPQHLHLNLTLLACLQWCLYDDVNAFVEKHTYGDAYMH